MRLQNRLTGVLCTPPKSSAAIKRSGSRRCNDLPQTLGGDQHVIKDWFFKGTKLDAWKRANPEAAADWDATLKRFGVD